MIGVPAKAESVNDPGVPPVGGHSGHSDQFFGDAASVEDLWEFAQEILHNNFSPSEYALSYATSSDLSSVVRQAFHCFALPWSCTAALAIVSAIAVVKGWPVFSGILLRIRTTSG